MATRRDYAAARSYALSRSLARRPPRGHLVPPPDRLGLVVARQLTPPPTPRPRPDFDARRRPHCRNDGRRRPRWRRDSRRRKGLLPRDGRLEQMALITTTSFGRVKANGGRTIANNPDSTAYSARLAPSSSPSTLTHIGIRVSIFPTFRERGDRPTARRRGASPSSRTRRYCMYIRPNMDFRTGPPATPSRFRPQPDATSSSSSSSRHRSISFLARLILRAHSLTRASASTIPTAT